jgi:TrmH family RNA methyltransferase
MIERIFSAKNKRFQGWQKLLMRKYRDSRGEFLIEGRNVLEDAFASDLSIKEIIVRFDEKIGEEEEDFLNSARGRIQNEGTDIYLLDAKLFDRLIQSANPLGIIAVAEKPACSPCDLAVKKTENPRTGDILILDKLQDPGNIGTMIRTADAAGFSGILVIKGTADIYAPKTVRSAAGSIFRLPIVFAKDSGEAFDIAADLGLRMVAGGFDTDISYTRADLSGKTAIIVGNEGRGISKECLEKADITVKIPMYGSIDSLNAAVAAGIMMYECVRQKMGEVR